MPVCCDGIVAVVVVVVELEEVVITASSSKQLPVVKILIYGHGSSQK